jgi:hypothetical protein
MAKAGYSAVTQADVALAAATAKSVLGVRAPNSFGVDLTGFEIGLLGNTSGQVPGRVELCYATFATNAPGTNSTAATVQQTYGRIITAGFTAAYDWSAEPTVLSVLQAWPLATTAGLVIYDFAEGRSYDSDVSQGFVIRVTSPNIVNVRATLHFERC